MIYGTLTNGQLIIHKKQKPGDIPVVYTEAPAVTEEEIAISYFEIVDEQIIQKWGIIENPYEPISPPDYVEDAEAIVAIEEALT